MKVMVHCDDDGAWSWRGGGGGGGGGGRIRSSTTRGGKKALLSVYELKGSFNI